jgi:hypothetical protein
MEASRHLFGCAARGFLFRRGYRFGAGQYSFINDWGLERLSKEKRSRYCPAIAQALGLLSSRALSSYATDRLSARDGAKINHRVQLAPRSLSARRETFDNQQGKDVKAKQHWCPLKQDHPKGSISPKDFAQSGLDRVSQTWQT